MAVLFILLAVGLIACLIAHHKGQHWAVTVLPVLIAAALLAGAWAAVRHFRKPTSAEVAADVQAEAGRALGELLASEVPAGDILIITYAPMKGETIFTESRLRGLRAAITNAANKLVVGGPPAMPGAETEPGFVVFAAASLGPEANAWLASHPEIKAVVSLLPYPPQELRLEGRPAYAFAMKEVPGWAEGLRNGGWKAAMIAHNSDMREKPASGWKGQFDLVTPETLGDYVKQASAP